LAQIRATVTEIQNYFKGIVFYWRTLYSCVSGKWYMLCTHVSPHTCMLYAVLHATSSQSRIKVHSHRTRCRMRCIALLCRVRCHAQRRTAPQRNERSASSVKEPSLVAWSTQPEWTNLFFYRTKSIPLRTVSFSVCGFVLLQCERSFIFQCEWAFTVPVYCEHNVLTQPTVLVSLSGSMHSLHVYF